MNRAPHPIDLCSNCRFYFGQLGDRDATIRQISEELKEAKAASEQLQLIQKHLQGLEDLPSHLYDPPRRDWPLTAAAKVARLVHIARYGWEKPYV